MFIAAGSKNGICKIMNLGGNGKLYVPNGQDLKGGSQSWLIRAGSINFSGEIASWNAFQNRCLALL